ncbi:hypothetical protein [Nocardioides rubriscoriae]|uniref:hypothetical protein n=1 Tax=Nocardioides rubriscoriae TaxID=642762 RepID=UPI0011DFBF07|nr:hypothetical protein [Nocardioides rubriscoriae]
MSTTPTTPTTPDATPDATLDATPGATTAPSGRHPVSIAHLVMGVAFAGLVVVWALITTDAVTGDHVRWLLPVPWVLGGVAGLVGLVASDRRHLGHAGSAGQQQVGWVDAGGSSKMEP